MDVAAAFEAGCVPTNAQAERLLSAALSSNALQTKLLSPSGSTLIADCRAVVETLRRILKERNAGEELQEFWWKSRGAFVSAGESKLKVGAGGGQGALDETRKAADQKSKGKRAWRSKKGAAASKGSKVKSESEQGEYKWCWGV